MKFSVREWRTFYDKIHSLSRILHDSRPTYTEIGSYIAPVSPLTKSEQLALESEIKTLSQKCNRYLDQTGHRMPRPLWHYDKKDSGTWASHKDFRFGHLVQD
jgi:hypothetical protein